MISACEALWYNHNVHKITYICTIFTVSKFAVCQRLTHSFFRSARGDGMFNGDANPMGAGGDGALESDSNFIGNGEEAVFLSP